MIAQAGTDQPGQRVLYLRWRPRRFVDVIGQDVVARTLRNAVARGSLAHGYLLSGPRGVGKTSIARILYKALNCEDPREGDSCGVCASCQAADAGRAMDLIEIDAASNRGIDDIRALRERVRFAPVEAKVKVYIVDEAHQLTVAAWDAFLKTLEEPPPNTVFVLATTAPHKVPATIVSRCQRFDLGRIPHTEICAHLERVASEEGIELERGVTERLARLAHGGLRDALSLLEQVASFAGSPVTLEGTRRILGLVRGDALRSFIDALAYADEQKAFLVLEDVAREGADLRQFLEDVVSNLRAALLIRHGAEAAITLDHTEEELIWLRAVAQHWAPAQVAALLDSFGGIQTAGSDEQQLLVQLELATAWATEPSESASDGGRQPALPATPVSSAAGEIDANSPVEPLEPPLAAKASEGSIDSSVASSPAAADRVAETRPHAKRPVEPESTIAVSADREADSPEFVRQEAPSEVQAGASPPVQEADKAVVSSPATTGPSRATSLVAVEARWPAVLDDYQGTLYQKMLVNRLAPVGVEGGVLTLGGKLDALDMQRLDVDCRAGLEAALLRDLGIELKVRFAAEAVDPRPSEPAYESLADYAAALFGGQVVESPDQ